MNDSLQNQNQPPLDEICYFDQLGGSLKQFSEVLSNYRGTLQTLGFTKKESFDLIAQFQDIYWSNRLTEESGGHQTYIVLEDDNGGLPWSEQSN